ncbi:MAG: LD-carboxypeptidase [Planctomycetes bacterium]|nr:LD-carboxypeptidase [Planctomycetota bacterium]
MALLSDPPAKPLRPPALEAGGLIGLVAPASSLGAEQARAAAENLRKRGYAVRIAEGGEPSRGYLAAGDAARANAFNELLRDPEVKAIVCLRGGYGSPRILDRIDYEALRGRPKIVVGYSDITALLIALHQRTGVITFHGPMAKEWAAGRGLTPFSEKYYWEVLQRPSSPLFEDWGGRRAPDMKAPIALAEGTAEGRLVGGNLSVISSTMGTPYEIDARGAILFLEEVGEKPFRIDRMLNQLRLAGKLGQARGVVLGVFAGCDARDAEGDLSLAEVFSDYFGPLGIPVLCDYPAGHVPDQAVLPVGALVRLDATARRLSILEPAVAAPRAPAAK